MKPCAEENVMIVQSVHMHSVIHICRQSGRSYLPHPTPCIFLFIRACTQRRRCHLFLPRADSFIPPTAESGGTLSPRRVWQQLVKFASRFSRSAHQPFAITWWPHFTVHIDATRRRLPPDFAPIRFRCFGTHLALAMSTRRCLMSKHEPPFKHL